VGGVRVVEIDVHLFRGAGQPEYQVGRLPQTTAAVAALVLDRAGAVQPQVGHAAGNPLRAGATLQVVDAETHPGVGQQARGTILVPRPVAEFDDVTEPFGQSPGEVA